MKGRQTWVRPSMFLFLVLLTGCLVCEAGAAPSTPATTPAPKVTTWKFIGHSPPSHSGAATLIKMAGAVSQRTKGQLVMEYHQWEEFGYKGPEMLSIFGSGAADIGTLLGNYHEGEEPVLAVASLPFLGNTEQIPVKLNALRPYMEKALDKRNMKVLLIYDLPSVLWEKNEINTVDDFKRLKIRVTGSAPARALRGLGAQALPMALGEIYQALATGILTGTTFSVTGAESQSIQEVTKHLYLSPAISYMAGIVVVNKNTFNSLPSEAQKVLVETAKEYELPVIDSIRIIPPGLRARLEKRVTIHDSLSPQIVDLMVKRGGISAWDEWIAKRPEAKPALEAVLSALRISR